MKCQCWWFILVWLTIETKSFWLSESIMTTSSLGNLKIINRLTKQTPPDFSTVNSNIFAILMSKLNRTWWITVHISTMWHQFHTMPLFTINTSLNPSYSFQLWLPGLFKVISLLTTQKKKHWRDSFLSLLPACLVV